MTTPPESTADEPTPENEPDTQKYDEVDPEDVVEDAIEFFGEGGDDPEPVTPPARDSDEPPPPNA
ncbi:hypothetical protein BH23ACT3_BH23ACT3_03420 [soil metagenome]